MDPAQLTAWVIPAALSAFACVLWWAIRRFATRLDARLDTQDTATAEIRAMLATDLRSFDVRLSVLEVQVAGMRK